MSVLTGPRIYFKGEISFSPCTSNNLARYYDEDTNTVRLPDGVTYDDFKTYIMGMSGPNIRSGWNYYGDHATVFVADQTQVTGGVCAKGNYVGSGDPLIGQPVAILGNTLGDPDGTGACRLVDIDPYSSWSSAIYFDRFQLGGDQTSISGGRQYNMHSYWINFNRNYNTDGKLIIAGIASVVWQTAISKDALTTQNSGNSALLSDLLAAMEKEDAQGLMVRFNSYRTLYFQNGIRNQISQQPRNDQELSDMYLQGEVFENPAYSLTVGVAGLWQKGEPANAPSGRFLQSSGNATPVAGGLAGVPLGPAVAELQPDGKKLVMDLNSTIPEVDSTGQKANFGKLTLKAQNKTNGGATSTIIGSLTLADYDQAAYEKTSGLVTIPTDASCLTEDQVAAIQNGSLVLVQDSDNQPVMQERTYTALTEARGLYLNQAETQPMNVNVFQRGATPAAGTQMRLAIYDNNLNLVSPTMSGSGGSGGKAGFQADCIHIKNGNLTPVTGGSVSLQLAAAQEGCCNLAFFPFGPNDPEPVPPATLNTTTAQYACIRVLPFNDDFDKLTNDQLTWDLIYNRILRVYDLIYPVMSEVIPLFNRPRVERAYVQIKAMIDPSFWDSTLYMPITRDLSGGKTRALQRWCDLVSRGTAP